MSLVTYEETQNVNIQDNMPVNTEHNNSLYDLT